MWAQYTRGWRMSRLACPWLLVTVASRPGRCGREAFWSHCTDVSHQGQLWRSGRREHSSQPPSCPALPALRAPLPARDTPEGPRRHQPVCWWAGCRHRPGPILGGAMAQLPAAALSEGNCGSNPRARGIGGYRPHGLGRDGRPAGAARRREPWVLGGPPLWGAGLIWPQPHCSPPACRGLAPRKEGSGSCRRCV